MTLAAASPLPIVVLISGNGSNLQAIIDAISGGLNAKICAVISNRPQAYGLTRARDAGIPAELIDHHQYDSREAFDQALMAKIDHYQAKLVVLAGFYLGNMINIHPSLLPHYQGLNTHQRVLDAGDTIHGVSIHFVSPKLDAGPIIMQAEIPVLTDDTADTLAARIHTQEHIIYPQVIRWFAEARLRLDGNTVMLDNTPLSSRNDVPTKDK